MKQVGNQKVPERVRQEREAWNAELDDQCLPLQYLRYFLEEIRSFHFLFRGGPCDII